ncbi:DNA helicase [Ascoidea rubescens DSM 1968]|uniref:DNA 3'-5' helicase n=1 Tax=Ascoidea rubescens DSM 1968 TaxID=1344418 RepID=A0A1D2VJ52_9ASCO|nr:P-loop containing nucleoside triphosphate hydrolase protein [Ascoidea rubescens DSM 1968]ODV61507.1 P-loop containing nucleoside triphosphate hydrolase protein [Ascoidea rubescens DSM 1968]
MGSFLNQLEEYINDEAQDNGDEFDIPSSKSGFLNSANLRSNWSRNDSDQLSSYQFASSMNRHSSNYLKSNFSISQKHNDSHYYNDNHDYFDKKDKDIDGNGNGNEFPFESPNTSMVTDNFIDFKDNEIKAIDYTNNRLKLSNNNNKKNHSSSSDFGTFNSKKNAAYSIRTVDVDDYHNTENYNNNYKDDQNNTDNLPSSQYFKKDSNFNNIDYNNGNSNNSNNNNYKHFTSYINLNDEPDQISTIKLPDKVRSIFNFNYFNKMQSKSFDSIYNTDHNSVISSPTGSGKTVLFELAILRLYLRKTGNDTQNIKVLYMAPTKALCVERQVDWMKKFSTTLNLTVGILTSDTSKIEAERVRKSNIIITTPEKWDLITRRWFDYNRLFDLIRLLLIDEIHILRDKRGSTLEVVTTRMKTMCNEIRIIALSATVPNIQDISRWLKIDSISTQSAVTLVFGEEYRAIKLNRFVYGYYHNSNNDFGFDITLNSKLIEILRQRSFGKPVLIFCPTRKICLTTCQYISKNGNGIFQNNKDSILPVKDKELSQLLNSGIAYHHAGLSFEDRQAVERNFISGAVKVLCSTSTLAVGVNLPAYLVIIKGTKSWTDAGLAEYSELDVLQMIGRAGRPQFEQEGTVVIMTASKDKQRYEKLVKGTEKIESCLHLNFLENLAAEISLGTIKCIETAVKWLKNTFFYTRFIANPTAYRELQLLDNPSFDLDKRLRIFCDKKINELLENQIIETDGKNLVSTAFGKAMSRHYIFFETMKKLIYSPKNQTLSETLMLLANSTEFKEIKYKRSEGKLLKEINSSPLIRFPLKTKEANLTDGDKISLIIQYELGGLEYPTYNGSLKLYQTFSYDKVTVFKQLPRIIRCMIDTFSEKKDSTSLLNTLKLWRCVTGKCWEDSPMVLRQLEGIGLAYVRKFVNHDVLSFKNLIKLDSTTIEYFLRMKPGSGNKILKDVNSIPKLFLKAKLRTHIIDSDCQSIGIGFTVTIGSHNYQKSSTWHKKLLILNIVSEVTDGMLIDFRRIHASKLETPKSFDLMAKLTCKAQIVRIHCYCEEIAGVGKTIELNLDEIPSFKFSSLKKSSFKSREPKTIKKDISMMNHTIDEYLYKKADNNDQFPSDDFDDDDDDLNDLLSSACVKKVKNTKEKNEVKIGLESEDLKFYEYNVRSDGKYECKHLCKDKTNCRHICCKEGLITLPKNGRASMQTKSLNLEKQEQESEIKNKDKENKNKNNFNFVKEIQNRKNSRRKKDYKDNKEKPIPKTKKRKLNGQKSVLLHDIGDFFDESDDEEFSISDYPSIQNMKFSKAKEAPTVESTKALPVLNAKNFPTSSSRDNKNEVIVIKDLTDDARSDGMFRIDSEYHFQSKGGTEQEPEATFVREKGGEEAADAKDKEFDALLESFGESERTQKGLAETSFSGPEQVLAHKHDWLSFLGSDVVFE